MCVCAFWVMVAGRIERTRLVRRKPILTLFFFSFLRLLVVTGLEVLLKMVFPPPSSLFPLPPFLFHPSVGRF